MTCSSTNRILFPTRGMSIILGALSALALLTGAKPVQEHLASPPPPAATTTDNRDVSAHSRPWPRVSRTCVLCHGFHGSPLNNRYPRLSGQPAEYLAAQLRAFADGTRKNPTMTSLAMALSSDEVNRLSRYFSRQTPTPYAPSAVDQASISEGAALVHRTHCAACHGTSFTGHATIPALAAQSTIYLIEQLKAFKGGARRDPTGEMNAIAFSLSPREIQAVAAYLAQLPESTAKRN